MILAFAPDIDKPFGGVRKIYRQVDILNAHGIEAAVLHREPGFRCTWFENRTPVVALASAKADILAVPEAFWDDVWDELPDARRVMLNQGCYLTFSAHTFRPDDMRNPYGDPRTIATIVVSEDCRRYLEHAFPGITVLRVVPGVDTQLFRAGSKRPVIAFMPRRGTDYLLQVVSMLKFRGALDGFELAAIDGVPEREVARVLGESAVFLTASLAEGFGLPSAEAMASGCVVVGFDGRGGAEFFDQAWACPVPSGDVVAFASVAERVLDDWRREPTAVLAKGTRAAEAIGSRYSLEAEERSVMDAWSAILSA